MPRAALLVSLFFVALLFQTATAQEEEYDKEWRKIILELARSQSLVNYGENEEAAQVLDSVAKMCEELSKSEARPGNKGNVLVLLETARRDADSLRQRTATIKKSTPEERLRHMAEAMRSLRAAGLVKLAEEVEAEAAILSRQTAPAANSSDEVAKLRAEVNELRELVLGLRKELNSLRDSAPRAAPRFSTPRGEADPFK